MACTESAGGQNCTGNTCSGGTGCGTACWSVCAGGNDGSPCGTLGSGGSGCTCSGDCKGECKDECSAGCNSSCSDDEAVALYQALLAGLNKKIYAADMQNINDMIVSEARARRRNKASKITSVKFTQKDKAKSSQIKQLQTNLKTLEQTTEKEAKTKSKIQTALGEELITTVLTMAKEDVFSDKTGD